MDDILDVYRQTIGPLYGFVSRRCGGDRTLAEDVVQETWLRAVDAWREKGTPETPQAWLNTVARNLLINQFRRQRPVALESMPNEAVLAVVDGGLATDSQEMSRLIHWGLAQMPERQAGLLEAFHLEERSVAGIARDYRLSERAVEGRLRRARLKLRHVLERALTRTTPARPIPENKGART